MGIAAPMESWVFIVALNVFYFLGALNSFSLRSLGEGAHLNKPC